MRAQLSKTQSLIMNSQILAQWGTIPAAVVQDSSPIRHALTSPAANLRMRREKGKETSLVWPVNLSCLQETNLHVI